MTEKSGPTAGEKSGPTVGEKRQTRTEEHTQRTRRMTLRWRLEHPKEVVRHAARDALVQVAEKHDEKAISDLQSMQRSQHRSHFGAGDEKAILDKTVTAKAESENVVAESVSAQQVLTEKVVVEKAAAEKVAIAKSAVANVAAEEVAAKTNSSPKTITAKQVDLGVSSKSLRAERIRTRRRCSRMYQGSGRPSWNK